MEFNLMSLILYLVIVFVAPPFFIGVINRVKSIFAARKGIPLFQLYFDIFKLFKKGFVYSNSTSYLFRFVPIVIFITTVFAGSLLPITGVSLINFWGDAILFVYLFALCRFLIIVAALDTASSFEGMGASREAMFGAFSELTVFIVIVALYVLTGHVSLDKAFSVGGNYFKTEPAMILLFCAFFVILLTENSRMPVDDPNTHLELTMIHEVMVLDYSGPDLGLILYASSIKLFIFMVFTSLLIFPTVNHGLWQNAGIILLKVFFLSILIGVVESVSARIRLIKIPQMLIASFVISLFALITAVYVRGLS